MRLGSYACELAPGSLAQRLYGVALGDITIGRGRPFALIAGPCVIEGREHTAGLAAELVAITGRLGVPFIFKASYDKANRTSGTSFRGPGLEEGLRVLAAIKSRF